MSRNYMTKKRGFDEINYYQPPPAFPTDDLPPLPGTSQTVNENSDNLAWVALEADEDVIRGDLLLQESRLL